MGDSRLRGRQRHDEQQSVSGLLTDRTLSEGEEEEVGGSLVLTGVEEQFQHRGIFDQSHTQLVQQEDKLRLHHTTAVWRGNAGGLTKQQEEHVFHVVLDGAGFVSRDGTEA